MTQLRECVSDRGVIYIEVPDSETPASGFMNYLIHFQHLTHFTSATLRATFARAGLKAKVIERYKDNPNGSGCKYPVLRAIAVRDLTQKPVDVPGQAREVWEAHAESVSQFDNTRWLPLEKRLKELKKGAKMGLFGAGAHTVALLDRLKDQSLAWQIIFDNNPTQAGRLIRNIPIAQPSRDKLTACDAVLISSQEYEDEIFSQVKDLAGDRLEILTIYR